MNYNKYRQSEIFRFPERTWPDRVHEKAPVWCSVDLRDGNQALTEPMTVDEKIEYFSELINLGFKEIEVGFPSASAIEYDFIRKLSEEKMIPDDVTVQVLVQCREHLIQRTLEAIDDIRNVIIHIYTNISTVQRKLVYGKTKDEIIEMAVTAAKSIKDFAEKHEGTVALEYSPESFTETEPEFAAEVCNAVIDAWEPSEDRRIIINIPATIENSTPNVFADKTEWISGHLKKREYVVLSVHPHNDMGTATAAAELALLAGAQRIEGTLFGNGERTGNADLINVACNLMAQGIDPELDVTDIPGIRRMYERLTKMKVAERHPYAGELVFTAFSGGHQDAINKVLTSRRNREDEKWNVPYLIIDPADVGRVYEPLVRINSQSGGGGVAFIMETYHGFKLPKGMRSDFAAIVQAKAETEGELEPDRIMQLFKQNYLDMKSPYHFRACRMEDIRAAADDNFHTVANVEYEYRGEPFTFTAKGNGPIDAVKTGLQNVVGHKLRILDYSEHALREGSNAQAAAYIHLMNPATGSVTYGVGVSQSTTRASIRAIFGALNRLIEMDGE